MKSTNPDEPTGGGDGPYGYEPQTKTALKKYWPFIGIGILLAVGIIGSMTGYI